jgi:hypothetical protein
VLETALPRLKRRFYLIYHNQKQFSASLERFIIHCRARAPGARPSTY